jgi:hypothetical protein
MPDDRQISAQSHSRRQQMSTVQPRKRAIEEKGDEAEVAPLAPEANPINHSSRHGSAAGNLFTKLICVVFFSLACLGLHDVQFLHVLLYSSHANRPLVNLGIFFCTIVVVVGSYMEYYRSSYLGEHLNYESAKTSTHAMLLSMILAGIRYNI